MDDPLNIKFNGMTMLQRLKVAMDQTRAAMRVLVPFLISLLPDFTRNSATTKLQRDTAGEALQTTGELLKTLMLGPVFKAALLHHLGPPPPLDAPEDALNLRAVKEGLFVMNWLAGIVQLDSLDAIRTDFKRLEDRRAPQTIRRDYYVDPRKRDELEKAEREFAVLLTYFVAAATQEKIPALLARLEVNYDAFRYWAAEIDKEQRGLLTEAGRLSITSGGLSLAQMERLSTRSRDVLMRDDHDPDQNRDRFPDLAGLDDEAKLRKLFDLVRRREHFSRS